MITLFNSAKMSFLTVMRLQLKKINALLEINDENPLIEKIDHLKAPCLYETIWKLSLLIGEANTKLKSIGQEKIPIKSVSTNFPEIPTLTSLDSFWSIEGGRKYFNDEKRPNAFYEVIFAYPVSPTHIDDEVKKEIWKIITELTITNENNIFYWDNYQCEWKKLRKDTNPWILSECQCLHHNECKRVENTISQIY